MTQNLASHLTTEGHSSFTAGTGDSPQRSLTAADWEKVKQTLDSLKEYYFGDIYQNESKSVGQEPHASIEDSDIDVDLKYIEKEISNLTELNVESGNHKVENGFRVSRKRQPINGRKTHGDSTLETKLLTLFQNPSLGLSNSRLTYNQISLNRKPNETSRKLLRSYPTSCKRAPSSGQNYPCLTENTNFSHSKGEAVHQTVNTDLNVPVPPRPVWRCRSAPELRHPIQREELLRRVSHYDLAITHRCDIRGRHSISIDSAEDEHAVPSLLWGEEAYRHYKLLTMVETKEKIQLIKTAKAAIIKKYLRRHRTLQNIVNVAKAYYNDPTNENRKEWKRLREEIKQSKTHSITDLRHRLAQIPNFTPVFTLILMLAQVVSLAVMCGVGKLAPAGVLSQKQVRRQIQTFLGAETFQTFLIPNPWIGPFPVTLLAAGASFAPCMRRDQQVEQQSRRGKYRKLDNTTFGCCRMRGSLSAAGTTTRDECSNVTNNAGLWSPPPCGRRITSGNTNNTIVASNATMTGNTSVTTSSNVADNSSVVTSSTNTAGSINVAGNAIVTDNTNATGNNNMAGNTSVADHTNVADNASVDNHIIRPCCVDHRGTCRMLSQEHCNFLGGSFHSQQEHCVEVLCLQDVCEIDRVLFLIEPNPDKPWLAKSGTVWQWWRLLLALVHTFGILHCVPLLLLEWLLMRPLEKTAGWFRVLVIYILCGMAGQIVACTAQPYIPHVGSTSGVAGMVGEAAVELSQAWPLLDKPCREAAKLACFLLLLLFMGLLPYVSLLGSLTGFGCGAVCALVFMPYITFDMWGRCKKVLLVVIGLFLLVTLHASLLYVFIQKQPAPCQACRSLECLSFTANMCNEWDLLG